MKKLLALFASLLLVSAAFAGSAKYPDISQADLTAAIQSKSVTVIDVNGTESYNAGHIPTAINFETHKDNLAASLPANKDALIVAYCGGPQCTAYKEAAKAAQKLGYTNVKHFSGGISGWKESGAKIEKS